MRQFLLTILIIAAVCRAAEFGDISIERLPILSNTFIPLNYQSNTYRLQNNGDKPASITIQEQVGPNPVHYIRTRSMELAPRTTATLSLYSPPYKMTHYYPGNPSCEIFINGKRQQLPQELSYIDVPSGREDSFLHILASPSLNAQHIRTLFTLEMALTTSNSPVMQWPTHARDYIGYSSIMISSQDNVPPEIRHALDDYVRLGGLLAVIVPENAPWPLSDIPESATLHSRQLGFGKIVTVRPINKQNSAAVQAILQRPAPMPGKPITMPNLQPFPPLNTLKELVTDAPYWTWDRLKDNIRPEFLKTIEHAFPMLALLLIMTAFAIVIGPLNYWLLHRKGKQLLLIFTTPVISIIFCLLVILFITFREGWRSHGATYGFTVLDQKAHQASTWAKTTIDAAFRPSGGFRFSTDDILTFQSGDELEVLDAPGQIIDSSVMQPRVPMEYALCRTEPRREQLDITFNDNNTVTVVNGLGAEVKELTIFAPDKRLFKYFEPLPPGGSVTLHPTSIKTVSTQYPVKHNVEKAIVYKLFEFHSQKTDLFGQAFDIESVMEPGQYVAWLEEPLFYSLGMKTSTLKATHFVIGRF